MTRAFRWGDDPKLPTWRLVVEDDDGDGLVTIQEELATSTSERAQTERVLAAIDLREDEARWLHAELGRLLEARTTRDARILKLRRAIAEAGDRHDADAVDELERELDRLQATVVREQKEKAG